MSETTIVALAGILATGLTALLTQVLNHRSSSQRDGRNREADRAQSDLAELRELLDGVLQTIVRSIEVYRDVRSALFSKGDKLEAEDHDQLRTLRSIGHQVDVDEARSPSGSGVSTRSRSRTIALRRRSSRLSITLAAPLVPRTGSCSLTP